MNILKKKIYDCTESDGNHGITWIKVYKFVHEIAVSGWVIWDHARDLLVPPVKQIF